MTATAVGLQERSGEGWLARTRSRWLLVALGIGIGTLAAVAPYLSSRSGPVSDYGERSNVVVATHVAIGLSLSSSVPSPGPCDPRTALAC